MNPPYIHSLPFIINNPSSGLNLPFLSISIHEIQRYESEYWVLRYQPRPHPQGSGWCLPHLSKINYLWKFLETSMVQAVTQPGFKATVWLQWKVLAAQLPSIFTAFHGLPGRVFHQHGDKWIQKTNKHQTRVYPEFVGLSCEVSVSLWTESSTLSTLNDSWHADECNMQINKWYLNML